MSAQAIAEVLLAVAVRLLPGEERGRWRDEWLAELDGGQMSGASKLRFALGICAGVGGMAGELHARRAILRTASVARSDFARPATGARPPYNAGVDFWS
jgi:hypothetical protein